MKIICFSVMFAACAAAPPGPVLSPVILNAVCSQTVAEVHAAGGTDSVRILVPYQTGQLVDPAALTALRERAGDHSLVDMASESAVLKKLTSKDVPYTIEPPNGGPCQWVQQRLPVDHEFFLEVSSPFQNPYDSAEIGVLARCSLGGQMGATWFWITFSDTSNGVMVQSIVDLDISDG